MAVTEKLMGAGNFSVSFTQEYTPTAVIESIKEWGHIVITPQAVDVSSLSDADILSSATYTGIVLNRTLEEGVVSVNGQGLELYLGDGKGKGMVIAESNNVGKIRTYTSVTLAEALFNSTVSSGKPFGIMRDETGALQAITQGSIFQPQSGGSNLLYSGQHFVETALSALKFICEITSSEYRVNPNGTIDAGPSGDLFVGVGTSEPTSVVVKSAYGEDPEYQGVTPQGLRSEFDATDFVTRVDFTGEVGFFDTATDVAGEANLSSIPYKDLHGNLLKRVGLVQEPDVPEASLNTRAQTMLNELSRVKKILNLDLTQYEVSGDMKVGDFVYAFDPDVGFVDTDTDATAESRDKYEVTFRGQTITPAKVRIVGLTFPIIDSMGVYFRDKDGNYTDLTQYVNYESGATQVELGDTLRGIGDDLRFNEFSLSREKAGAFSIPDLPSTPTLQSGTYLDATGVSSGFIRVTVSKPTNLDGSQITDGSHYKVRYKKTTDTEYSYQNFPYTGANSESLLIQDLTVGVTFDVGVAVVDKSGFKKMSAYDGTGADLYTNSSSVNANFATNARIEIEKDGQAPSKPKTATSIATGPLKVQITHHLGKDGTDGSGNPYGNFTLEGDIDYLAVHAVTQSGNTQNFTVSTSNKIGEIRVTAGNLLQSIPLVGSADLADSSGHYFRFVAVDKSGNASNPSDGQTGTASLIEETHIKDATITDVKIGTAQITGAKIANATITDANIGSLNADKINAGSIDASQIAVTNLSASNIASGTLSANLISGGSISANLISGGTISADLISGGTINGSNITVTNLNADNITTGTLNGNQLEDGAVSTDKVADDAITDAKVSNLSASSITTGTLNADNVTITNLSANSITGGTMSANRISGGSIDAGYFTGAAGFSSLTAASLGITGAIVATSSGTFGSYIRAGSYISSDSYLQGTQVRDEDSSSLIDFAASFVDLKPAGSSKFRSTTVQNTSYDDLRPGSNDAYDLGASYAEWRDIYAGNTTIQTSDISLKTDVEDITLGLDFVNTLEPIEFKWTDGGVRTHLGFSAQDVKQKLIDAKGNSQNYGVYTQGSYETQYEENEDGDLVEVSEPVERYGLRTGELIPVLTKAIQELSARVEALEG